MKILEELIAKTPEGIIEMMKIKGIGQKKIFIISKEKWGSKIVVRYYAHVRRNQLL